MTGEVQKLPEFQIESMPPPVELIGRNRREQGSALSYAHLHYVVLRYRSFLRE